MNYKKEKNISKITKDKTKKNNKKYKKQFFKIEIISKIIIISLFILGYLYVNSAYSNTISLLAVNEDSKGNINSGSIVDLTLKIKPGSGNIFINLNTIEEVDTEISIINSQKIACDLFKLDCENYDFYYDFKGSALVLKGPSASSAIAILTVKTMNRVHLDQDVVITGSLNSGGIVGNVGGVNTKIKVAQDMGFKKVLVPAFSTYDENITRKIKVIKVIDLIEAYNKFNGDSYKLDIPNLEKQEYLEKMKILRDMLCKRTEILKSEVNFENILNDSTEKSYIIQAKKSFNNSLIATKKKNYYSAASFCYNANINYRILIENQKNKTINDINLELNQKENEFNLKLAKINSQDYKNKIQTINDFYSYLVIQDRISEARDFIKEGKKIEFIKENYSQIQNITNNNPNFNISSNSTKIINSSIEENTINQIKEKNIILSKNNYLSYAIERFYTIGLWEKFIENQGDLIKFDNKKITSVCKNINRQINIQAELLKNYNINFLNKDIEKQLKLANLFSNQYLCIYQGLELNGKINTILNSVGIEDNKSKEYIEKIYNFTQSRVSLNSNGNFPLIPYIYSEYSGDLIKQNDLASSMLYSNYALSYLDLNLYLEDKQIKKSFFNEILTQSYENIIFITAILLLIGFLGIA